MPPKDTIRQGAGRGRKKAGWKMAGAPLARVRDGHEVRRGSFAGSFARRHAGHDNAPG